MSASHIVLHFTAAQFVLLMLAAMVTPFALAALLRHFFKVQNADAHVNHVLVGLLVACLFFMVFIKTDAGSNFFRSMDGVSVAHAESYHAPAEAAPVVHRDSGTSHRPAPRHKKVKRRSDNVVVDAIGDLIRRNDM